MSLITIHFDGGTPCNIPRLGYGIGYGSYNYNGGEPIRVNHGIPCSNNAAEILTLCEALENLPKYFANFTGQIQVVGDSKIAIKWLNIAVGQVVPRKKSGIATGSQHFKDAIQRLGSAMAPFPHVSGRWLPRAHAVAAFGH